MVRRDVSLASGGGCGDGCVSGCGTDCAGAGGTGCTCDLGAVGGCDCASPIDVTTEGMRIRNQAGEQITYLALDAGGTPVILSASFGDNTLALANILWVANHGSVVIQPYFLAAGGMASRMVVGGPGNFVKVYATAHFPATSITAMATVHGNTVATSIPVTRRHNLQWHILQPATRMVDGQAVLRCASCHEAHGEPRVLRYAGTPGIAYYFNAAQERFEVIGRGSASGAISIPAYLFKDCQEGNSRYFPVEVIRANAFAGMAATWNHVIFDNVPVRQSQ